MGEEIKITDVQVENQGTLIQVDTDKGRLFVPTRAIFKALNNYHVRANEQALIEMGFEKIDHDAPLEGLIE